MQIKDKIKILQEEIKDLQTGLKTIDPMDQASYGDKVRELMKLRRQQVRKGRKENKNG